RAQKAVEVVERNRAETVWNKTLGVGPLNEVLKNNIIFHVKNGAHGQNDDVRVMYNNSSLIWKEVMLVMFITFNSKHTTISLENAVLRFVSHNVGRYLVDSMLGNNSLLKSH
ncbi:hypothetical protein ACJX0J_030144, partial [Zea mays]